MSKLCAVYYLVDPETFEIRYVGISTDPRRRYSAHLKDQSHAQRHSSCWIRGLTLRGLKPVLRIAVYTQTQAEAKRIEIALIAKLPNLTNISSGGEGGTNVRWSDERKAAHSARMRERYQDPEARARHGEATKRGWDNPESRARASIASTGRVQSMETRAKKSATLMGHTLSQEAIAKIAASHTGTVASLETRAKMSASHMGHVVSAESRAKARATQKAKWAKRKSEAEINAAVCVGS